MELRDSAVMRGDETSVYVVSKSGQLMSSGEYLTTLGGLADGQVGVEKASRQRPPRALAALRWRTPRIAFDDLVAFYDVNTWHRRCIGLKALLAVGLGWQIIRADGDLDDPESVVYDSRTKRGDTDHPAVKLCLRPSRGHRIGIGRMLERAIIDYLSVGNAFMEVVRDRAGRPAELYHARALRMRRAEDLRQEGRAYYQLSAEGERRGDVAFAAYGADASIPQRAASEIIHLYAYDPRSDYYGQPGWLGALGTMGLTRTVSLFNTKLFANNMMATYAVVVRGGRLSNEGREAIQRFVRDRASGAQNAGRVLLLENERDGVTIDFEPLTMQVKNLMITEAQPFFREEVIAAHGVPLRLLGIVTPGQLGATGEVEGQLRTFRETIQRPMQREVEGALGAVLDEVTNGYDLPPVRLRFMPMDVTNARDDADFYAKMIEHGVFTAEEVRQQIEAGAHPGT